MHQLKEAGIMRHQPENSVSPPYTRPRLKASSNNENWTAESIPNLWDKVVLITGATSGIGRAADEILADYSHLNVLINNAAIMACPYAKTEDGVEIQMATNHLGHFALSRLMLPLLRIKRGSRIVNTSSIGHRMGKIDLRIRRA
jgi:NAD(P)-dependent dehydrogenase (short-subunit alcohol dehydrogenase family)